jgi:hypothetical protein
MQDDKLGKKWFGDCLGGARRADMLKISDWIMLKVNLWLSVCEDDIK